MLKNSLILLLLIVFSSCATQKRCLQKFPPSEDTLKIIQIKDSIVYRDTTIFIDIPGDTKIDSIFIPCPDLPINWTSDTLILKTNFAISKSWVERNKLKASLVQPDTTLQVRLDNALKEKYYWKSQYEKVTVKPQPVKYIPKLYSISFYILIGELILILIYVLLKILK